MRFFYLGLLLLLFNQGFSQSSGLSQSDYNTLLNKQFRLIMTGTSNNVIGNFATLDLSEAKRVTFAPTFQLQNSNLLSLKFNGGISDGFADIFTNSGLNSNFSFDAEYNFLRRDKGIFFHSSFNKVQPSGKGLKLLNMDRIEINHKYLLDTLGISSGIEREKLIKSLDTDSIKYTQALIAANLALADQMKLDEGRETPILDTLRAKVAIQKENLRYTKEKMANVRNEKEWKAEQMIEAGNKWGKELAKTSADNLIVRGFRMGWFSFGGQIRNDAFKLFDPVQDFADRIENKNYVSFQGKIRYSLFSWFPYPKGFKNTWYMMFGLTYNFRSNYQDLALSEVTITSDYGSNGSNNMTSAKKYNVYSGEYRTKLDEAILSYDAYFFLKNIAALHFFPSARYTEHYRPRYSMGFGFLYPIKGKEDKTIINAEVYANLVNMFRNEDDGFDLFQDYKIGLRFSVPFQINQIQKQ
jgi:hypothetical protein